MPTTEMKLSFTFERENESIGFASYLCDCGVKCRRKGKKVYADGNKDYIVHLYEMFITMVLV